MLRENLEEQCRKISPDTYGEKSVCSFVRHGGMVGFIDTSGMRDGTRGIAFFGDRMYINTDGELHEIAYKSISGSQIISSFEDSFADELSVSGDGFELRISDYSLDKFELKRLLDELCREQEQIAERHAEQAEKYAEIIAQKLAEEALEQPISHAPDRSESAKEAPQTYEPHLLDKLLAHEEIPEFILTEGERPVIAETVVEIPAERSPLSEDYAPAPIPEEKIDWLSGANAGVTPNYEKAAAQTETAVEIEYSENEKSEAEERPRAKPPEIMNGVIDRVPVIGTRKPMSTQNSESRAEPQEPPKDPLKAFENKPAPTESEMRERIENMAPDEMMKFLSNTLNEINDQSDPFFDQTEQPIMQYESIPQTVPSSDDAQPSAESVSAPEAPQVPEKPPSKWAQLTTEPIWGDIYIKASQNLRELCENGKLSMEQMETEIKERLLSTADAFEKIIDDESRVPKVMIPKITELKAAVENFEHYFDYGEDIAIRAMFFMMYQMLSYADRIVESPETKDRLNDFFRRFGSAGITLSMLDMRV